MRPASLTLAAALALIAGAPGVGAEGQGSLAVRLSGLLGPGAVAAQQAAPLAHAGVAPHDPDDIRVPEEARARALADLRLLESCPRSFTTGAAAGAAGGSMDLARLRAHYLLAVEDGESLRAAWGLQRTLASSAWGRTAEGRAVLEAYRGALTALDAKHGFWPHARIRDLRRGLDLLDAQVERTPTLAEVRYLRLLSNAFLPGILGRRATAEADLEVLASLLPEAAGGLPFRTWSLMADTVEALLLEHDEELARSAAPRFGSARRLAQSAPIPLAAGCRAD